jgi:hypothetical protein
MSDTSQGPGWWQASDGRWYPPTATPGTGRAPTGPPPPGYPPSGPSPAPYGYGYGYAPNPNRTASGLPSVNGYAVASFVLGLLSVFVCCYPLAICSLVGLPLGIYALRRITTGQADPGGKGLAVAGVVLSALGVIIIIVIAVLLVSSS